MTGTAPGRFVAPGGGWRARWLDRVPNAAGWRALRRRTIARLPFPVLRSDVRNVIYANWLVPVQHVAAFVPQRVSVTERDGLTLLTVLTYRHGHFGPRAAGPLRRLFPSPLQGNWRLYVDAIDGKPPERPTVLFISNVFDATLYALGTRLMSDALPSHLAACFRHESSAAGAQVVIEGGSGSAPSLMLAAACSDEAAVPPRFASWYGNAKGLLAAICLQDAAVVAAEPARLAEAWIDLPIDLRTVELLHTTDYRAGALLRELGAVAPPWCFRVPAVPFTVLRERLIG